MPPKSAPKRNAPRPGSAAAQAKSNGAMPTSKTGKPAKPAKPARKR